MLFFIDESGKLEPGTKPPYAVLAAVSLAENPTRAFHQEMFEQKRKLCSYLYEQFAKLTPGEIPADFAAFDEKGKRRTGHRVPGTINNPADFEVKGRELLNEYILRITPDIVDLVYEFLNIAGSYSCKVFATGSPRPKQIIQEEKLSVWYQRLIERINEMLSEMDDAESGILIFDQTDRTADIKRAVNFWRYTFGHEVGKQWQNIQIVLFSDSKITPGIEVADILAYVINARAQKRKALGRLYKGVDDLEWISNRGRDSHLGRGIRWLKSI